MHMQFGEETQDNYFFSQPHQPFFVLAFISAIFTMLLFFLAYNGFISFAIEATSFHIYGLTYLVFTPAFLAFLFTTFPKFSYTPAIVKKTYMRIFSFFYLGATLFLLGSVISPILSAVGMVLIFVGHTAGMLILKNIYATSAMEDTHDIFWILRAMQLGVLAHLLFIIGETFHVPLSVLSTEMSNYLYLFLLTFAVSQRMVPFLSHCMVEKNKTLIRNVFLLLVLHVVLESIVANSAFLVDLLIAYLIGKEVLSWKLPFPNPNPLLWILHVAMYWIPVAFLMGGLTNLVSFFLDISFLALDTHSLILGFVFTILIGFGTRVTLGHSGNVMQADRWTTILFYWTQVVVVVRILVSLVSALGWNFMTLFDISVAVWIVMFVVWAIRFFAVLIQGKKLT